MSDRQRFQVPDRFPEIPPSFTEAVGWLRASESEGPPGSWLEFCERHGIYQLFTREYVEALAGQLGQLRPRCVVEVGAGSGGLTRALRTRGVFVRATDRGDWPGVALPSWVETMDVPETLARYRPDLVIAAWLPVDTLAHRQVLASPTVRWFCVIDHEVNGLAGPEVLARTPGWTVTRMADADRWALTRWDSLSAVTHGDLIQHGVTLLYTCDAPPHVAVTI